MHVYVETLECTNTHIPNDKITNVLHCCVQDLTKRESDLLGVFVQAVAVISTVPRHGRPTGSHLPQALRLPLPTGG